MALSPECPIAILATPLAPLDTPSAFLILQLKG